MKTMLSLRFALIALFFVSVMCNANAQMSKYEALYIYNFAKSVRNVNDANKTDLVITVLGDLQLQKELQSIVNAKTSGRKMIVKGSASVAQLPKSDVIVVGKSMSAQMPELVVNQGEKALIVSTQKGLCGNGAAISLFAENGKLTYEICRKNIKHAGMHVPQHLISLGIEVF
ncbi:MAG: YfiR family protein [Bacteroidia bacterium]|nr:YfiR family protein [Bacteroidia bacterium]